jgi:hypothetical protein
MMVSGGRHPRHRKHRQAAGPQKNPTAAPTADGDNPPLKDRHFCLRNKCNRIEVALADNPPDG